MNSYKVNVTCFRDLSENAKNVVLQQIFLKPLSQKRVGAFIRAGAFITTFTVIIHF